MSKRSQRSPSFLASLRGYLRPGGVTAREGAAGTAALAAVLGGVVLVAVFITWMMRARARVG